MKEAHHMGRDRRATLAKSEGIALEPVAVKTAAGAGARSSKGARDTAIKNAFAPLSKPSLSGSLVRRIKELIQTGEYKAGDRLPSIMEMARRFGVGHPTIREALKILETMGVVEIRHGSGVFVARSEELLVLAIPDFSGTVTKKLLVDLIDTRMSLEMRSASDAVNNGTKAHLAEMHRLLKLASENLENDAVLSSANMSFHREIAVASGNTVLTQVLDVLQDLFKAEQRLILGIFGSRERDHKEHLEILDALERRDEALCVERMRKHLDGVRAAVLRWDPAHHPVG
jgi:GntR family transcriptional repressor for pyruvate dehydrogenase complex